ncbi:MAG: carbon starvation CstA family protein [Planctomycetota bacterium]
MGSVLIAVGAFVGYIVAYKTYGRFLSKRLFNLDCSRPTAAVECEDGVDYVPTKAEILFGHHYTSIAGTGPIVGPAIGIIWGWLPALIWVILGSILMGAVHDFGALVVSMRNKGKSIGDIAAEYISPRVRMMFLGLVALALTIVLAIFCLVIAAVFSPGNPAAGKPRLYPEAVLPVWFQIPIAVVLGHLIYRKKWDARLPSIVAVILMYGTIILGAYVPIAMPPVGPFGPIVVWTVCLLIYCYVASVLPVWRLLQPRDYINGHQLFIALGLLALGTLVAHPKIVAPMVETAPVGAPPLWPFLFIFIACGAISGFHSLVGSGTTSKQICRETDACAIGYGAMLLEGMLAIFVIIAVAGGFGMGTDEAGRTGAALWQGHYANFKTASTLAPKLKAFVDGAANMLEAMWIPKEVGLAIMGVFVASFAATTLDTATRIQRYVLSEIGAALPFRFMKKLSNKHVATLVAVLAAGVLALHDGKGAGGMTLWPLFGATNQLLACLALLVVTTYLRKKGKPIAFTLIPAAIMFVITGFAMTYKIRDFAFGDPVTGAGPKIHLLVIGVIVVALEVWMAVEAVIVLLRPAAVAAPPVPGAAPAPAVQVKEPETTDTAD